MTANDTWKPATEPEDLARYFLERANAGDLEGLVALYEPEAVLALRTGEMLTGHDAIRDFYGRLLQERKVFSLPDQEPVLRSGELALTSTRKAEGAPGGATAEVARQQGDGSWLWVLDQPNVMA